VHSAVSISDSLTWVGVNDRETDLFEGIWPLPRGVSYNSYLLRDAKCALIDTVKHSAAERYVEKIRSCLDPGQRVDYLIVNHMEPDHSGSIRALLSIFPEMKIVGNKKTAEFLERFYGIREGVVVVDDGATLELGSHTLSFHLTPMVHWPETMMTYDAAARALFSGDAFGGFGALHGGIFDDEVDLPFFEEEILRYFANVIGKYSGMVDKAIAQVAGLDIRLIAPTHGPVWRKDPAGIVARYQRFCRHEGEEGVVIVYGSMYGFTERMMEAVAAGLAEEDVSRIRVHDVFRTHASYLIRDAWRFRGLILGSPTYDTKLSPPMDAFVRLLEHKALKRRVLGLFGTFGWGGGGVRTLLECVKNLEWDLVEPVVEARCAPTPEDLAQCVALGQNVVRRLKAVACEQEH
jgi:flavorubredoxin